METERNLRQRGRLFAENDVSEIGLQNSGPSRKEEPTCFGCHTCVWKTSTTLNMLFVPRYLACSQGFIAPVLSLSCGLCLHLGIPSVSTTASD